MTDQPPPDEEQEGTPREESQPQADSGGETGSGGKGAEVAPPNEEEPEEVIERATETAVKRELRIHEWLMAFFTVVIACAAIAQCHEMHTGGLDTHNLADETTNLANAAGNEAVAESTLANTSQNQLAVLSNSVAVAQQTASAAKASAQALAGQLAEMQYERRPWVFLKYTVAGPIKFMNGGMYFFSNQEVGNGGGAVARNIAIRYAITPMTNDNAFKDRELQQSECDLAMKDEKIKDYGETLFPGQSHSPQTSTSVPLSAFKDPRNFGYPHGITLILTACAVYRLPNGRIEGATGVSYQIARLRNGVPSLIHLDEGDIPPEEISFGQNSLQAGISR